jgi:hypothetical protein
MTGRNNVGKSRLLESASKLMRAFDNARTNIDVPQVRVVTNDRIIELDPRPVGDLASRFNPAPRSYTIRWKNQPSSPGYRMEWTVGGGGNLTLRVYEENQPIDRGFGTDVTGFRSLSGIVPLHSDFSLDVSRLIYIPPERPTKAEQDTVAVDLPAPDAGDLARAIYSHLNRVTAQAAALQSIVRKIFPEVEMILTPPAGANRFTLRLRDRYAGKDISLDDVGTGVARIVHLITAVLFYPAGRIFLIDEPTTHLHPGSEKVLAGFFREHDEHAYVIATHSPIFINAVEPDRVWLVTRNDEAGSRLQRVFRGELGRRHVFDELGTSPGDIALAERVIFVEGSTDAEIYPILLERLGLDLAAANAAILPLHGAGNAEAIQQTVEHLSGLINLRYLVYLDGDKRGHVAGEHVRFLPEQEIENVLLRDPLAVYEGFAGVLEQFNPDRSAAWRNDWPEQRIRVFINERIKEQPKAKGGKVLSDLAYAAGLIFNKSLHGPAIARALDRNAIGDLRRDVEQFLGAAPVRAPATVDDTI